MSDELSFSPSSLLLPSKNGAQLKRQNENCDTGGAGDFQESAEASKPVVVNVENVYKRRRGDAVNGAASSSIGSVINSEASAPVTKVDGLSKMVDGEAASPVPVPNTINVMPNVFDRLLELPLTEESITNMAVGSGIPGMEASSNDNNIAAVAATDNNTTPEVSAQNTSNASRRQLRIRLRRYRHQTSNAVSSPLHEDASNESDSSSPDEGAGNSQNRSNYGDDSVDFADGLPFIFHYDSSTDTSLDYGSSSPGPLALFDPSSSDDDDDTNIEDDLSMLDDGDDIEDEEDMEDGEANIEEGEGIIQDGDDGVDDADGDGTRKSYVFGVVDSVLSKDASACNWNTTLEVMWREYGMFHRFGYNSKFNSRFYASQYVIERMKLSHHLRRHSGCVNSLNFNRSGELVCSGSDDKRIIIWDWARNKCKHVFKSGHRANIFQTKFLNGGTALDIVSAGRDGQVRRALIPSSGKAVTYCLYKHRNAVHKLAICPSSPFEILSVGEDGYIRHCDLRTSPDSISLLKVVNDTENRTRVRLFSIAHHPYAPEVCVCGSDEYVRVYDKRNIAQPIHKMCPQSLMNMTVSQVTCCTYNHNGSEVLATYSDDQIYLFENQKYTAGEFLHVYRGHHNHRTIKGVNFFGPNSEYVISGSDCGNIFFWDKATEAIVNFMPADALGVVNCLEPHPSIPVLATSGLDYNVKIWSPGSERTTPSKEKLKSCIMRNIWRSGLEGRDILDSTLNDIILEAFHPDVFDSDDSISFSSNLRYGPEMILSSSSTSSTSAGSSSNTSNGTDNGTRSTENNDHQYYAHGGDSDDSSENEVDPLSGLRCQTQ